MTARLRAASGKRVAVVGSGPAGLTCAGELAMLGHDVTVFESLHVPGGVLVYGIPEFRLPKDLVRREIEMLRGLGVEHRDRHRGRRHLHRRAPAERGFDAVFIGAGAGLPVFMDIPGENLNGVYSSNEYLTRVQPDARVRLPARGHARLAPAQGRRGRRRQRRHGLGAHGPAARRGGGVPRLPPHGRARCRRRTKRCDHARQEGVIFDFLTLPIRLIGDERGWLTGIECRRMELGEPDASGRRRPVEISGSEFVMAMDASVCAIGNSPNPLIPMTTPGLEVGKKGNIVAREDTGATSRAGVWAGGDVVTGAATVISAMGAGRRAAASIDAALSGAPDATAT